MRSRLDFLEYIGVDTRPDPANIPELRRAGWGLPVIAETYGVSVRTIQRYLADSHLCLGYPEGSCLTQVKGGGLCGYCRRTKAL